MKAHIFILRYSFILMMFLLGGCGVMSDKETNQTMKHSQEEILNATENVESYIDKENFDMQNMLNDRPLDVSDATEISLNKNAKESSDLLCVDFEIDKGNVDTEAETYVEISECVRNKNDIFYVRSYGEEGAQFYYLNRIYCSDLKHNKEVLLYETDAVWLNEFLATDMNLYWVEYVFSEEKGDFDYNVMQYNLSTEVVTCIASRNAVESEEICLAVSNDYVAWYDSYWDGRVQIIIFDIEKQEIQNIQDANIKKFMPYERLNIVDDYITFFSQDEEGWIYINRYNLNTYEKDVLLLGKKEDYKKLAACFSDSKYIGWLTEYSYGTYYFYNIETGNLYSLSQSDEMRVFSGWLSDYLFINESQSGCVYVYDFDTKETYYQNITQGTALSLRSYGDYHLYMKVVGEKNVELLTVQSILE